MFGVAAMLSVVYETADLDLDGFWLRSET